MAKNKLYYGDNLDVLRRYLQDESVDVIYLDPPFNSDQDYNVLFERKDGTAAAAQIKAFEDTWHWDMAAARALDEVVTRGGGVADAMLGLQRLLGESDMLAYLAMMAPRLVELRRVLKSTGSVYLHCDPTASHYLKLLMDAVFGPANFRNEIVWKRTAAKGLMFRRLASNHDVLLCYQKTSDAFLETDAIFLPYDPNNLDEKTESKYSQRDPDGRRYQLTSLINPNPDRPNLTYEFLGVTRVWRWTQDRMQREYEAGRVIQTKPGAVPRYKRYLDEQRGKPLGDVWTDIPPLNSQAQERLGYPTQKPIALVERILRLSCPEDGVALDPFCGCGTTVAAAEKLRRKWIGIDITHLAVNLMKHRLLDMFGPAVVERYEVRGEPTTPSDAAVLAREDPYQFQFWALGLVGARPQEEKRGADKGVDGRLYFRDPVKNDYRQIVISVKAGKMGRKYAHELNGVVGRENAEIGVLISLNEPTKAMREEAASAGFYHSPFGEHPRLQLVTVRELLDGARLDYPRQADVTYKRAPRHEQKVAEQLDLGPVAAESAPSDDD